MLLRVFAFAYPWNCFPIHCEKWLYHQIQWQRDTEEIVKCKHDWWFSPPRKQVNWQVQAAHWEPKSLRTSSHFDTTTMIDQIIWSTCPSVRFQQEITVNTWLYALSYLKKSYSSTGSKQGTETTNGIEPPNEPNSRDFLNHDRKVQYCQCYLTCKTLTRSWLFLKSIIIPTWLLEHGSLHEWPARSQDLKPTEHRQDTAKPRGAFSFFSFFF